ncbi:tyrosine phosphatase [Plakobranchus ocellatus]|uniref:Tyrosine phosphatase n=1 Tax=Plakobranchus ocellatus TaxID=259542 RepID=A0AAV3YWL2_9GAST|nr:tyrosine phosphatase [Plakobranchus ocellatus]
MSHRSSKLQYSVVLGITVLVFLAPMIMPQFWRTGLTIKIRTGKNSTEHPKDRNANEILPSSTGDAPKSRNMVLHELSANTLNPLPHRIKAKPLHRSHGNRTAEYRLFDRFNLPKAVKQSKSNIKHGILNFHGNRTSTHATPQRAGTLQKVQDLSVGLALFPILMNSTRSTALLKHHSKQISQRPEKTPVDTAKNLVVTKTPAALSSTQMTIVLASPRNCLFCGHKARVKRQGLSPASITTNASGSTTPGSTSKTNSSASTTSGSKLIFSSNQNVSTASTATNSNIALPFPKAGVYVALCFNDPYASTTISFADNGSVFQLKTAKPALQDEEYSLPRGALAILFMALCIAVLLLPCVLKCSQFKWKRNKMETEPSKADISANVKLEVAPTVTPLPPLPPISYLDDMSSESEATDEDIAQMGDPSFPDYLKKIHGPERHWNPIYDVTEKRLHITAKRENIPQGARDRSVDQSLGLGSQTSVPDARARAGRPAMRFRDEFYSLPDSRRNISRNNPQAMCFCGGQGQMWNRFPHIAFCEETRVVLKPDASSKNSYIHANYITGYRSIRDSKPTSAVGDCPVEDVDYIASASPFDTDTSLDFWRFESQQYLRALLIVLVLLLLLVLVMMLVLVLI